METTLNPCPECLHDGTLICCMDEEGLLFVQCSVCGLSGKRFMTVAEAVDYWNSIRATGPAARPPDGLARCRRARFFIAPRAGTGSIFRA